MKKKSIFQKRPIILLEVLIAFALVSLCALPLIYPHMAIFKAEKRFVDTIELDHLVNLLFANRLEKLYLHEIPWADIEGGKEILIEKQMIQDVGYKKELPFMGTYQFIYKIHKPLNTPEDAVYLYKLVFQFIPKGKQTDVKPIKYEYTYDIMIERKPS